MNAIYTQCIAFMLFCGIYGKSVHHTEGPFIMQELRTGKILAIKNNRLVLVTRYSKPKGAYFWAYIQRKIRYPFLASIKLGGDKNIEEGRYLKLINKYGFYKVDFTRRSVRKTWFDIRPVEGKQYTYTIRANGVCLGLPSRRLHSIMRVETVDCDKAAMFVVSRYGRSIGSDRSDLNENYIHVYPVCNVGLDNTISSFNVLIRNLIRV